MELFLVRFLTGASALLLAGLLGAMWLRRGRGPAAACDVLRIAFVGVLLCALAAALPAPVAPLARVPLDRSVVEVSAAQDRAPVSVPIASAPPISPSAPVAPTPLDAPQNAPSLIAVLLGVWALGALVGLGQLFVGHLLLRRLRRSSAPVSLELPCSVEVRESARIGSPLLAGCVRPVLYLPESGPLRDDPASLSVALAHELAHLARRDLAWSLLARILRAALWFHPLVHIAARQQELLAEQACDEAALVRFPDRQSYARLLLALADGANPTLAAPVAGMALSPSRVGKRIAHLLAAPLSRPLSSRARLAAGAVAIATLTLGASLVGLAQKPVPGPKKRTPWEIAVSRPNRRRYVSLNVKNRPLKEVVAEISRLSLYPITLDPRLSGNVTLAVKEEQAATVLAQVCQQTKPASGFVDSKNGLAYSILALPSIGKFVGQVLTPEGEPSAGTGVGFTRGKKNASRREQIQFPNEALTHTYGTVTNKQGYFELPYSAEYYYQISAGSGFLSGNLDSSLEVFGLSGKTVRVPTIRLLKGVRIDLQYIDTTDRTASVQQAFHLGDKEIYRHGMFLGNNIDAFRAPAGKIEFFVNESQVRDFRVKAYSGKIPPQIKNKKIILNLKPGDYSRIKIEITPSAQEISRRIEYEELRKKHRARKRERLRSQTNI